MKQSKKVCTVPEFIMHLLNGAGVEISGNGMEQISPQELADKVKKLEGDVVYLGRAEESGIT